MKTNLTSNHEAAGLIPGLDQWVKDLALLWLWYRLAAVALIRPLAWEPPYAAGVALKRTTTTTKKTLKKERFNTCKMVWKWTNLDFLDNNCLLYIPPGQCVLCQFRSLFSLWISI